MKYLVIDEKGMDTFVKEFETKEEAIQEADAEFERLTAYDKKQRNAFYVLESVNPDEEADDHFDGDIIKDYFKSPYLVANLAYITLSTREREIKNAATYEDFELYKAETGWQDWMEDFTDADDGEECAEAELKVIEEMQRLIWAEAHEKKTERINLRVSPALKYEAERKASEEARSLNSYIEWLILNDK